MKQVKWGIIGLGGIASKFADGFQFTKNARLFAISSKNDNKLLEFKNKFQIDENFCFSNYESLLECKDLDIVYIALPHSFHHEWVIKSIERGKNILVEKPATVNFSQMENIKNNLKNKNIFFSEAFMYRYHPQISKVVDLLKNNVIGNLVSMESLFGFDALGRKKIFGIKLKKKPNRNYRLYNKEFFYPKYSIFYKEYFKNFEAKTTLNTEYNLIAKEFFEKEIECILDVGANIGYQSSFYNKFFGNKIKIHSFEPHPISYYFLEKNLSSFDNISQ